MSNWKDKVKGMLFESTPSPQTSSPSPSPAPVMQSSVVSGEVPVEVDERLLEAIEKKIQEANIPGPDYLELKDAAEEKSFVSDEPDEGKRWRQAFRNMKTYFPNSGISKVTILNAIDSYIGIVREEVRIGNEELRALVDRDVIKAKESIATIDSDIEKLEKELEKKKGERDKKLLKIQESQIKYEHQEKVFNMTTDFVINMLESDKVKINQYIVE